MQETAPRRIGILAVALALASYFIFPAPVSAQTDCAVQTDIPQAECETLVALYNSADGPNWKDAGRNNWNQDNSPCGWTGVACAAGNVTEIIRTFKKLAGTIPDLSALTNLAFLNLSKNKLTGVIPDLSALTNLYFLDLQYNQLSGAIPDLSALTNLNYLVLFYNQLTGVIPNFSALVNLQRLSLGSNRLTGGIPDFSALTNLEELNLENNQLTGGIPDFSVLTNLQKLYLGYQQLSGAIPDFSALTNLRQLILSENQLTGAIPDLSALTNLRQLFLDGNQLTGDIPPSLAALPNLTRLYMGYNMLTASDPALVDWLNVNDPGWSDTQTVPPEMIGAAWQSPTSVQVTWTRIPYSWHGGFYRVFYSRTPGEPYTEAGTTADKIEDNFIVAGLQANTRYYFVVETYTPAHGDQQNDLTSALSEEV